MKGLMYEKLSLWELAQKIQSVIDEGFNDSYWVSAEISELKENRTRHCYLELVEKDSDANQPRAKVRATIWAGVYRVIKPFFETSAGVRLASGIRVLVLCKVNFHPVYGLSLNIQDIDPAFTIGDIEQKRRETIERLIAEGVFDMNKELEMPMLPKRIAIVSSPSAAGYQDFINQLDFNPYGYKFGYKIFSAVVQGDKASDSIIEAFFRINLEIEKWDVVALIRGGGSQADLLCFDEYELANHIAQFPIPVITGIGHEKDTSVADLVAHTRLKTPTAAAEFLINQFVESESIVSSLKDKLSEVVGWMVNDNLQDISSYQNRFIPHVLKMVNQQIVEQKGIVFKLKGSLGKLSYSKLNELNQKKNRVSTAAYKIIDNEKIQVNGINRFGAKDMLRSIREERMWIEKIECIVKSIDPEVVMRRGYSITLHNGKPINEISKLLPDDQLETVLKDGKLISSIKKIQKG